MPIKSSEIVPFTLEDIRNDDLLTWKDWILPFLKRKIRRYADRVGLTENERENVESECLVRAYGYAKSAQTTSVRLFLGAVYKVMRSQGAQQMRNRGRRERVFAWVRSECENAACGGIPQKWIDSGSLSKWREDEALYELRQVLSSAFAHTSDDERSLIECVELDEVPISVVAAERGTSRGAIDQRLYRAKLKLRHSLFVEGSDCMRCNKGGVQARETSSGARS